MRAEIVRMFVTCKVNWVPSKNLQNFISFFLPNFVNKLQNPAIFYEILRKILKDITAAAKI